MTVTARVRVQRLRAVATAHDAALDGVNVEGSRPIRGQGDNFRASRGARSQMVQEAGA